MRILRRLLPYLAPCRTRLIEAFFVMLAVAVFNGSIAYFLKPVIDDAIILKDSHVLRLAVWLIPAIFLLKLVLYYMQAYLMSYIGQKTTQLIREDLFRHLHRLSMDFYWKNRSGEILSRVTNDLNTLQSALQFVPLYLIRDSVTVLVLIGVLFHLDWKFALIALAGGPAAAILLSRLGKKLRSSGRKSQSIMGEIYHRFQESLQGMLVIKAFNYEEGAIRRFKEENAAFFDQTMRYLRATALSGPLMEFLGSLILAALIYMGGLEIIHGTMTPGSFFAFLGCFFSAYIPIKNLAQANPQIQISLASAERIFQILDEQPTVKEKPDAILFSAPRHGIIFEDVSVRYPGREAHALQGINLSLRPGEVMAVVGPSGSGKSTLVHLLLRFFDPTEGRILADGKDLRDFSFRSLRDNMGMVTQDTVLFSGTVLENILIGKPRASRAEALEALKTADAYDFVQQLPQKEQTQLGERGVKLSGGQRQRIAIARAVLRNPPLLILDEATSNLDSESEASVQRALERLFDGRSVLQIAHRLSTVRKADRIVVLEHGKTAESGTHEELLARAGLYASLYELQQIEPETVKS